MSKHWAALFVVLASANAAWAVDKPIPSGSFESGGWGFGATINNWTLTYTGTVPAAFTNMQSGLFGSFGKFAFPPNGGRYLVLSNLGAGTVQIASGAPGTNFFVDDRALEFRYVWVTNDPATGSGFDQFQVQIDFFATASSTTPIGTILQTIAYPATFNDSAMGFSPFDGPANPGARVYNNGIGTNFNLIHIDIEPYLGSYARVTFLVDNSGPAAGTNSNGLGVSGVLLDYVVLNPEPSTLALVGLGVFGLAGLAWRRRRARRPL